jgi:hypothetical protein
MQANPGKTRGLAQRLLMQHGTIKTNPPARWQAR